MRTLIIISLACLIACDNVGVTETEVKAVQVVLDNFGGICNRHKGFETENGVTETYFELKMSESKVLENFSEILEVPASNIAYLFYSNLGDEKEKYTHIKVTINLKDGGSKGYYYADDDIEIMNEFAHFLFDISDRIKAQDYDGLLSDFEKDIDSDLDLSQIQALCQTQDSLHGKIIDTKLLGFTFHDGTSDKRASLRLLGILQREKANQIISSYIDMDSKKLLHFGFDY